MDPQRSQKPIEPGKPFSSDNVTRVMFALFVLGVMAGLLFVNPETPEEIFAFIPIIFIVFFFVIFAGKVAKAAEEVKGQVRTEMRKMDPAKNPFKMINKGLESRKDAKKGVFIIIGIIIFINIVGSLIASLSATVE